MPRTALDRDLQSFAVELIEHSGGVADWPTPEATGSAVVPAGVVAAAHLPGEEFAMGVEAAPGTLQVGLGGEFLDVAARVLDVAVPRDGSFRIPDRRLTGRDLSDKVAQSFGWQNARARCQAAEPALVEYHLWTLLASLRSEDVWEAILAFGVNAESQAVVDLPDALQEPDVVAGPATGPPGDPTTYDTAVSEGKRRLIRASAGFVRRVEQRLERDRQRLQDYYRALSDEAGGPRRRAAAAPSPEEVAARKRAVDLELRRKLAEIQENYAMRAELKPVVLARVHLPALVVPVVIQRKQATRAYRLYWNSLLKKFEPLSCGRCRRPTFSATFTNEAVDLLCTTCAAET